MTSDQPGPGMRRFMELRERGDYTDIAPIIREHPDEALAIAEAVRQTAIRDVSQARERMWRAYAGAMKDAGEDSTLGEIVRSARDSRGLSAAALSAALAARGVRLRRAALERIEADRMRVTSVRPEAWAALIEELAINRHQAVAGLTTALLGQRPRRFPIPFGFALAVDQASSPHELSPAASDYLDRVRAELGLPLATDSVSE